MAFKPLTTDDVLLRGQVVRIQFEYSCVSGTCPTEDQILSALRSINSVFEGQDVDFDTISYLYLFTETGRITGKVQAKIKVSELIEKVKNVLNSFVRIWGTTLGTVEAETFTLVPEVKTQTAVVFAAVAVVAIVAVIVFLKVT